MTANGMSMDASNSIIAALRSGADRYCLFGRFIQARVFFPTIRADFYGGKSVCRALYVRVLATTVPPNKKAPASLGNKGF